MYAPRLARNSYSMAQGRIAIAVFVFAGQTDGLCFSASSWSGANLFEAAAQLPRAPKTYRVFLLRDLRRVCFPMTISRNFRRWLTARGGRGSV
jgi:hypothetical protein